MRTSTFAVPSNEIPVLKGAARQLEIDLTTEPPEEFGQAYITVHAIIFDDSQLVALGYIAGIDASCNDLKNPLTELIDKLERGIEKFNKDKNDDK